MEKKNNPSKGNDEFTDLQGNYKVIRNYGFTDSSHELALPCVYPVVFNVSDVNELKITCTALYRADVCPWVKKLDGKRGIDYIVEKRSEAFPQFKNQGVESFVQEKWRDNKYRVYKDIVIGVGNPDTVKGEIFKLQGASHFIYGFIDRKNNMITEWLCITQLTRLVTLVHEKKIDFKFDSDENGKLYIMIKISTLKEYGLVDYHYSSYLQ